MEFYEFLDPKALYRYWNGPKIQLKIECKNLDQNLMQTSRVRKIHFEFIYLCPKLKQNNTYANRRCFHVQNQMKDLIWTVSNKQWTTVHINVETTFLIKYYKGLLMIEKMQRWTSMSLRNLELVANSPKTTRNWFKKALMRNSIKSVLHVHSL